MAHFLKPEGASPEPYVIDGKLAPGSLAEVKIPLNAAVEVVLWGGPSLKVTSRNNTVVPNARITERALGDLRVFSLFGASAGTTVIETGGSVTLPAAVGAVTVFPQISSAMADLSCQTAVLNALTDPAVAKINLRIDGFTITPQNYAQVKEKVIAGKVQVKYNAALVNRSTGNPYGFYHAPTNVLTFGFTSANSAVRKGLIVHEATHVACDVANYSSMSLATSEAIAYIAQAIFMAVKQPNPEMQADPILAGAQILADRVLSGGQLNSSSVQGLREAIQNSPDYRNKAPRPGYDGVP